VVNLFWITLARVETLESLEVNVMKDVHIRTRYRVTKLDVHPHVSNLEGEHCIICTQHVSEKSRGCNFRVRGIYTCSLERWYNYMKRKLFFSYKNVGKLTRYIFIGRPWRCCLCYFALIISLAVAAVCVLILSINSVSECLVLLHIEWNLETEGRSKAKLNTSTTGSE
jgi:hypothetical protein